MRALFQKLINLIKRLWAMRLVRFFVIGVVNTLFSYIIFSLLSLIGLHYSLAKLISTVLGIIFNFFTTGRIVFNNHDNRLVFRFFFVYGITYLVDLLFLYLMVDKGGLNQMIAEAIATVPVALLSYLLNSLLTFKTMPLPGSDHTHKSKRPHPGKTNPPQGTRSRP